MKLRPVKSVSYDVMILQALAALAIEDDPRVSVLEAHVLQRLVEEVKAPSDDATLVAALQVGGWWC